MGLALSCHEKEQEGTNVPKFMSDEKLLAKTLNALMMDIIDGMNAGDYGYSLGEARLISSRACTIQEESFPLLSRTDLRNSVAVETEEFHAHSAINIQRKHQDHWLHEGREATCDQTKGAVKLPLTIGTRFKMSSRIDDRKLRTLTLTLQHQDRRISEALTLEKEGQRSLEFHMREHEIQASLVQRIRGQIKVKGADDFSFRINFRPTPSPLHFNITMDHDRWQSYGVEDSSSHYTINSEVNIQLNFVNVSWEKDHGCMPQTGLIYGKIAHPNKTIHWYLYLHQDQLATFDFEGGQSYHFLPFGCVLEEKALRLDPS